MAQQQEVKHSEAKAMVAQQKPRDASGKFLSGAELEMYRAQQQQAQFDAERNKVNAILGKSQQQPQMPMQQQFQQQPMQNPISPNIPQPRDNFMNILNANKPGQRTQQGLPGVAGATDQALGEEDKWNVLLGKKRTNIRW